MARLRFIAPHHVGHTCTVFGRDFPHGEWVDAAGLTPDHLATLAANPTFEAELDEAAPKSKGKGKAGAEDLDTSAEDPAKDPAEA